MRIPCIQYQFSSIAQSCPTLWPHGLQHTRLPCQSPTPACSNSCSSSQWYHPTISSSVVPFSSCPQAFPVSGCFPASQLFTSGGLSIGISASGSLLLMNIQGFLKGSISFRVDWFDLLAGDSQESSPTPQFKSINSLVLCFLYGLTLTFIHDYWKNHVFVGKIMSLLFICCLGWP